MNARMMFVFLLVVTVIMAIPALAAPQLQIVLPLGRAVYQTNEQIDLSVVRSDAQALPAGDLSLVVTGNDGSKLSFTFPMKAIDGMRTTEHLHLNGWLLRPGKYLIEVGAYGTTAQTVIDIYSHIRRSNFKLLEWGSRAQKEEQAIIGEDSLGFNFNYAMYGGIDVQNMIRGGVDFMRCCTLGGGHQVGLRLECDWSDPYVLRGSVIATAAYEALRDRTAPNCTGVHFYDEPGLTWQPHPKTGQMVPFNIPAQDKAYKAAFDADAPQYNDLKGNPALADKWREMARWKESFMEATWKLAADSVSQVNQKFISTTQSVYGFWANTDGYYFNITRSLPMISGHGGYSDWGPAYFHPSLTHEFGRMRDYNKPNWYLPAWNGNMPANQIRMEQYLSFMTNLQGMMIPPDQQVQKPYSTPASEGVVESNKTMARLGTIFTTMPVTKPEVAVLYSMSQLIGSQIAHLEKGDDPNSSLSGDGHNLEKLGYVYIASKLAHIPLFPIVEEDVLDGTLAANHKAVVIYGTEYLEPNVVSALEQFIAGGGTVLVTDDSKVQIKGAVKLGTAVDTTLSQQIGKAFAAKDEVASAKYNNAGAFMKAATPLAKALAAKLGAVGIKPVLDVEDPQFAVSRQALGDVEYLFAVNVTYNEQEGKMNSIKAATTNIRFPNDGRPVYDAVRGGQVTELPATPKAGTPIAGKFSFGAGQMRVFARTIRPIGSVQVQTPVIKKDFTRTEDPIRVSFSASVSDNKGTVLTGAIPLRIRVIDPMKAVRYDLYRATDLDACKVALPLAVNDPSGAWTVEVTELLNNTVGTGGFTYKPATQCGAAAGATQRAIYFGNDRENIFRFFRQNKALTIIKGTGDYNNAAAERLATILKPWGINSTIKTVAEVNKPHDLPEDALKTWAPPYGGYRVDPKNINAGVSGYAVDGAVLLLGNPEDNPIIKYISEQPWNGTLLPYKPKKGEFPGDGRGYLAWQRCAVNLDSESITLIAYDAQGMSEAVGSMYEAATGLDPLMPLAPPTLATVNAAITADQLPEAPVAWQAVVPDRAVAINVMGNEGVAVVTIDGTLTVISPAGKVLSQRAEKVQMPALSAPKVPDAVKAKLVPLRIPKFVQEGNGSIAVGYWGGTLQIFGADGALKTEQLLPQDISAMAWMPGKLVVALADGHVLGLDVK